MRWHSLALHTAATAPAVSATAPAALAIEEQRFEESVGALSEALTEALAHLRSQIGDDSITSAGVE